MPTTVQEWENERAVLVVELWTSFSVDKATEGRHEASSVHAVGEISWR